MSATRPGPIQAATFSLHNFLTGSRCAALAARQAKAMLGPGVAPFRREAPRSRASVGRARSAIRRRPPRSRYGRCPMQPRRETKRTRRSAFSSPLSRRAPVSSSTWARPALSPWPLSRRDAPICPAVPSKYEPNALVRLATDFPLFLLAVASERRVSATSQAAPSSSMKESSPNAPSRPQMPRLPSAPPPPASFRAVGRRARMSCARRRSPERRRQLPEGDLLSCRTR
jgi:hypothetical protein